jgi:hypothetical protein
MRDADEAHSNDEADEARCKLNTLIEEKGYRTIEVIHPEKNVFSFMREPKQPR